VVSSSVDIIEEMDSACMHSFTYACRITKKQKKNIKGALEGVVIVSAVETDDRGFDSRQGVSFRTL
jgi:translation initiation factor IF-1